MKNKASKLVVLAALMFGLCVICIGCAGGDVSSASRGGGFKTEEGEGLSMFKWERDGLIPIYFSDKTVPAEFEEPLVEAMAMWEERAGRELFDYRGWLDSASQENDGRNVIYFEDDPDPRGHFAETRLLIVNKALLREADMIFYRGADSYDVLLCAGGELSCTTDSEKIDIVTAAIHELGHVLGYGHTDEDGATMNPDFSFGDVRRGFDDEILSLLSENAL